MEYIEIKSSRDGSVIERRPKPGPEATGCLIEGSWGHYASARAVQIAGEYGWSDNEAIDRADIYLSCMGPSEIELDDDTAQMVYDAVDRAEQYLNSEVAMTGYYFGWEDGEFYYRPSAWFAHDA